MNCTTTITHLIMKKMVKSSLFSVILSCKYPNRWPDSDVLLAYHSVIKHGLLFQTPRASMIFPETSDVPWFSHVVFHEKTVMFDGFLGQLHVSYVWLRLWRNYGCIHWHGLRKLSLDHVPGLIYGPMDPLRQSRNWVNYWDYGRKQGWWIIMEYNL